MKLAIVSPLPPEISGVGQYGARVSAALATQRRMSEVRVFANCLPGVPLRDHYESLTVERVWRRDHWSAAHAVTTALRQWQPDVVWFNLGLTVFGRSRLHNFFGLTAPVLARSAGLPTVVTLHEIFEAANLRSLGAVNGRLTHWGGQAAMRLLLQADTVCVTLHTYAQMIRTHYRANNVVHVPHGAFDPPGFVPLPPEKRILIFATYAPYKGLPELISAFRELYAADSTIQLLVAGSDHLRFPGYLGQVRSGLGDLPGVEWRIGVPEASLPELFASARVIALPYTATTGASSVAHRAAAHGRPVVAYDLPDLRAVAAEEGLCFDLIPPGDRQGFVSRLRDLLNDPQQCERIGRANVSVMQAMTLETTCQHYLQLFERAARRKGDKIY